MVTFVDCLGDEKQIAGENVTIREAGPSVYVLTVDGKEDALGPILTHADPNYLGRVAGHWGAHGIRYDCAFSKVQNA